MHSLPFEEAWSCVLEDPVGGTEVGGVVPEGEIPPEDPPEVSLLDEFSALVAGLAETWVITESIGASLNSRRPMESRDIPGFTSENLKLSSLQKSRQMTNFTISYLVYFLWCKMCFHEFLARQIFIHDEHRLFLLLQRYSLHYTPVCCCTATNSVIEKSWLQSSQMISKYAKIQFSVLHHLFSKIMPNFCQLYIMSI
jgi:hypothetical protein